MTSIWLVLFSITVNYSCVTSDSYIVTSPESHCPTEFMGEPCLTLKQYAYHPSESSHINMALESGNHLLTESISLSSSYITDSFMLTAENAKIVYTSSKPSRFDISASQLVWISGITFTGSFTHIVVSRAQEVIVSECSFQGVSLQLIDVANATISRCNFSDYRNYDDFYYGIGALSVGSSDTVTVTVVHCNFSNNEGAIDLYGYIDSYRYTVNNVIRSLNIRSSTFINTWGYWGSAVYFYVHVGGYSSYSLSQYAYGYATLDIIDSNFTNNTSEYMYSNCGSAVCFTVMINRYYSDSMRSLNCYARLNIMYSTFTNNTNEYRGGAVSFKSNADNATLLVHQSTFIDNTASQNGGALYLNGWNSNYIIRQCNFIHNYASLCGAISIVKYYDNNNVVEITDSFFNTNRAVSISDIGGGAVCIMNTTALISNCTFIGNIAIGFGGAMVSHDSTVLINDTTFHNNLAGRDGGALITYTHPSSYTITHSTFTHNQAGDDGGAIFVGHRGSYVRLEMCTFTSNHAIDRGGAIAIFGSTIEITETSIDNNRAALGDTFSSCNSNVMTSSYGYRDNCSYDGPSTSHFNITSASKNQTFTNITLNIGKFCIERQQSQPMKKELNKVSTAAYASITISVTIVIAFLLYLLIEKLVQSKIRCMKTSTVLSATQLPSEPLYDEATLQHDNAETIEMKPNVLYERCEPQSQAQSQEITSS